MAKASRRGRSGDGSVFLSRGKWVAVISYGGRGARRYRRISAATKGEAVEALRRLRSERMPLAILAEPAVSLETCLRAWLSESVKPTVRATLRLATGDHPKVVSEILGHASIQITLDTYSHVLPSLQRDAADRFDAVL